MLTFAKFMDTVDGIEEARILLAALEIRIFTILGKTSLTARQISSRAKTDKAGTLCLLNALVAMGALRARSGKYSNAPEMYKHLCATSPHYKKGSVHLMRETNDEWAQLLKAIRKGRDPKEYAGGDDPKFRRLFTYAMHERSLDYADDIVRVVTAKPVGRLLDLGAGPASYSAAILKKDKRDTATALDRPSALKVAKELVGNGRLSARFRFLEGDLFDTPYGENYNTVFFANILHIYSLRENKILLKKIARSLAKGGRIVLVDLFLKDDRAGPYHAAMFSLTMLLFTATGRTYTFTETEKLLGQCGFVDCKRTSLKQGAAIIEAIKK